MKSSVYCEFTDKSIPEKTKAFCISEAGERLPVAMLHDKSPSLLCLPATGQSSQSSQQGLWVIGQTTSKVCLQQTDLRIFASIP